MNVCPRSLPMQSAYVDFLVEVSAVGHGRGYAGAGTVLSSADVHCPV
jgi:hypothetical protein